MSLTHHTNQMKKAVIALTCITTFTAATLVPAPAKAWGGLINAAIGTTVNAVQENERRNAEIKRLEIEAQERATEEAIQAEVDRRIAEERQVMQNKIDQLSKGKTTASSSGNVAISPVGQELQDVNDLFNMLNGLGIGNSPSTAPSTSQRPLTLSELQHFCSGYFPGTTYRNGSCIKNGGGSVVDKDFARRWLTSQGY